MLTSPARLWRRCRLAGLRTPRQLPAFRYHKEKSRERRTVCWRGLDSNFQYAGAVNLIIAPFADCLFRLLDATSCVDGEMAVEAWSYKRGSLAAGLEFLIRTTPIGRPQRAARVRGDGTKRSNPVPPASESISPGSRRPPEPAWRGQSRPARSRADVALRSASA
jgi:hypothetical protein